MADLTTPVPHDISELLTAYLDGELRPGELDVVVEHLTHCAACILEFHELKEIRAALRSLPYLKAPDHIVASGHYGASLSAYLDGELPTAEFENVFTHLQECTECRADLHELDAARTAVRSLPGLEPPDFLEAQRETRAARSRLRPARLAVAIAGAAAVLVLAVGVTSTSDDPVSPVDLDSFADRHVARASVEPGFQVIPAVSPRGVQP
jgi:anti-sigma factor RsiW